MTAEFRGNDDPASALRTSQAVDAVPLAFAIAGIVAVGDAAPAIRFRRTGEAFTTASTRYGRVLEAGSNAKVRFDLPDSLDIDFIELEIPAISGQYRLESVSLQGTAVADLSRRVIGVRDRLLRSGARHEVRYASDHRRPSLEVDVRGLISSQESPGESLRVDVVLRREEAIVEVGAALAAHAEALSVQLRDQSREMSELAFGHGQELRRQELQLANIVGLVQETIGAQIQALKTQVDDQSSVQQRMHEQIRQLHEQVIALNVSHSKGIAAAQQAMEQTHDQVSQLRFAVENVFWRRWLRRLRRGGK